MDAADAKPIIGVPAQGLLCEKEQRSPSQDDRPIPRINQVPVSEQSCEVAFFQETRKVRNLAEPRSQRAREFEIIQLRIGNRLRFICGVSQPMGATALDLGRRDRLGSCPLPPKTPSSYGDNDRWLFLYPEEQELVTIDDHKADKDAKILTLYLLVWRLGEVVKLVIIPWKPSERARVLNADQQVAAIGVSECDNCLTDVPRNFLDVARRTAVRRESPCALELGVVGLASGDNRSNQFLGGPIRHGGRLAQVRARSDIGAIDESAPGPWNF